MATTDLLSDALTKIRNASRVKHPTVDVRATRLCEYVLRLFKQEGFIRSYKALGDTPSERRFRVYLKYTEDKEPAISTLVRVSRPGEKRYCKSSVLPRVLNGIGTAFISTSNGVITEREARKQHVGGEVLCYVW